MRLDDLNQISHDYTFSYTSAIIYKYFRIEKKNRSSKIKEDNIILMRIG